MKFKTQWEDESATLNGALKYTKDEFLRSK